MSFFATIQGVHDPYFSFLGHSWQDKFQKTWNCRNCSLKSENSYFWPKTSRKMLIQHFFGKISMKSDVTYKVTWENTKKLFKGLKWVENGHFTSFWAYFCILRSIGKSSILAQFLIYLASRQKTYLENGGRFLDAVKSGELARKSTFI